MEWAKVIELLAVNRLAAPESELGVHQRWYARTAMDVVLGTDDAVAAATYLSAGITSLITTNSRDFRMFGVFKILEP